MYRTLAPLATCVILLSSCSLIGPGDEEASCTPDPDRLVVESPSAGETFDEAGLIDTGDDRIVLDDPAMVPAAEATWMTPDEIVLGITADGEAQAFPLNQFAYHHVANTELAGEPYLVTY